jgi:hypothetical protein
MRSFTVVAAFAAAASLLLATPVQGHETVTADRATSSIGDNTAIKVTYEWRNTKHGIRICPAPGTYQMDKCGINEPGFPSPTRRPTTEVSLSQYVALQGGDRLIDLQLVVSQVPSGVRSAAFTSLVIVYRLKQ